MIMIMIPDHPDTNDNSVGIHDMSHPPFLKERVAGFVFILDYTCI